MLLAKKGKRLLQIPDDYTVVDIETTGFKTGVDNIIEIAALKVRSGKVVDEYSTLIYRKEILNPAITKLTGITSNMLLEGKLIKHAINEFLDFLGDNIILGHNITFDINFLDFEAKKLGKQLNNDFVDTLYLSKQALPDVSHKLENLVKMLGIDDDIHHRAMADCYHAYRLANRLKRGDLTIVETIPASDNKGKPFIATDKTKAINKLNGILIGITCDDILSNDEIYALNSWLSENRSLAGNYPFDMISSAINEVLKDGMIDESEREYLLELFKEAADPLSNAKRKLYLNDLKGKTICLSGEFTGFSKEEFTCKLNSLGAIVKETVTRKTEILIVGGLGSKQWACGNYGNKVKKALEMQEQGIPITIIMESDIRM